MFRDVDNIFPDIQLLNTRQIHNNKSSCLLDSLNLPMLTFVQGFTVMWNDDLALNECHRSQKMRPEVELALNDRT